MLSFRLLSGEDKGAFESLPEEKQSILIGRKADFAESRDRPVKECFYKRNG